jgi:hypothetical protein
MKKALFIISALALISLPGLSAESQDDVQGFPVFLSMPGGTQSVDDAHGLDFFQQLENRRFFLWRWLFGERPMSRGVDNRVSRSQGVTRAPLAKTRAPRSNSRNPAELGGGSSRRPSSNSVDPGSLGGSAQRTRSNSTDPATLGGSTRQPRSNSLNPANLFRGTRRPQSGSTSFRNEPRPPLQPSRRDEFFGISQREIGINIGTAHAFTDVGGTKQMGFADMVDYQMRNPNLNVGVFARFRVIHWFGVSASFDYASFSGMDETGELEDFESYSFKNDIFELGGKVEFYVPMKYGSPVDIYGFSGLSVFYNNPRLFDSAGEERGITQSVALFQPAIPLGVGANVRITPRVRLGYELGYRYLVFNFLDGVYVSGSHYDSYLYNHIKVSYGLPSRSR